MQFTTSIFNRAVTIEMMNLDSIDWDEILKSQVKPDFYEINKKALAKGREIARAA